MRDDALAVLVDLQGELEQRLKKAGNKMTVQNVHFRELKKDVDRMIDEAYTLIAKTQDGSLRSIALLEAKQTNTVLNRIVGVNVFTNTVPGPLLAQIVKQPVILGAPAKDWWMGQSDDLRTKFSREMSMGLLMGETNDQLARRIIGIMPGENETGLMAVKRRQATALVRTSAISVSNSARLASFDELSDMIEAIQWIATLDSKTTVICRGLNLKLWKLGSHEPIGHDKAFPGPTAHWQCRSTQIAKTKSWAALSGKKIKALDDQTLKQAIEAKLEKQKATAAARRAALEEAEKRMDGQAATVASFEKWAGDKTPEELDAVIGPGRAILVESGKMTMEDLTDQSNRPLTVEELAAAVDSGETPPETLGRKITIIPKPVIRDAETQKAVGEAITAERELTARRQRASAKAVTQITRIVEREAVTNPKSTLTSILEGLSKVLQTILGRMDAEELATWKAFWAERLEQAKRLIGEAGNAAKKILGIK
jgi:hypothetical protein